MNPLSEVVPRLLDQCDVQGKARHRGTTFAVGMLYKHLKKGPKIPFR